LLHGLLQQPRCSGKDCNGRAPARRAADYAGQLSRVQLANVMPTLRTADSRGAQDELLLLLAHELRNPVHTLCTALDVLDVAPPGSDTSEEAREVLRRQGARLTAFMDELLAVGRVLTGRVPITRASCDLSALVGDLLAARPQARLRAAGMAQAAVTGDHRWLRQAIASVLDRALQHAHEGLQVRLVAADGQAILALDGEGQPIRRPRPGLEEPPELQLFIARHLLELHGGSLEQDASGTALRWRVLLPLASQASTLPCVTPRPTFQPE
jgi:signal transduction histidine kinase